MLQLEASGQLARDRGNARLPEKPDWKRCHKCGELGYSASACQCPPQVTSGNGLGQLRNEPNINDGKQRNGQARRERWGRSLGLVIARRKDRQIRDSVLMCSVELVTRPEESNGATADSKNADISTSKENENNEEQ